MILASIYNREIWHGRTLPKFYVLHKPFHQSKVVPVDVLECLWADITTPKGNLSKPKILKELKFTKSYRIVGNPNPTTRDLLTQWVRLKLMHRYWSKCEAEHVLVDWPQPNKVDNGYPVKVDIFASIEPNLPLITDLVYNAIKFKL